MKKLLTGICIILGLQALEAQYITEVLEYRPAPGQYINSLPWGCPVSAGSITGSLNGALSLGAFGGEVIFRFAQAVENHPDNPYGIDFTIFGNPLQSWSEPGAVWVMQDENGNGLPDEGWYELAGSDYYFSSTRRNAIVRFENPGGDDARDVPWSTEGGASGWIRANSSHLQPYYPLNDSFPHLDNESYTLRGTLIRGRIDVDHPPLIVSHPRAFGYADNLSRTGEDPMIPDNPYTSAIEGSGGDAFDISWAVDSLGKHVELDSIHFVRVQNAILHEGGYLGELSTEIAGAVDIPPNPGKAGPLDMLVLADLPVEVSQGDYQLEAFYFRMGRLLDLPGLSWTCSESWSWVGEDHVLHLEGTGELRITVQVTDNASLAAEMDLVVVEGDPLLSDSSHEGSTGNRSLVYPNPAHHLVISYENYPVGLELMSLDGRMLRTWKQVYTGQQLGLGDISPGLYLLRSAGPDHMQQKIVIY